MRITLETPSEQLDVYKMNQSISLQGGRAGVQLFEVMATVKNHDQSERSGAEGPCLALVLEPNWEDSGLLSVSEL